MCRVDRSSRYRSRHIHEDSDSSLRVEENDFSTSDVLEGLSDPQYTAYLDHLRKNETFFDEENKETVATGQKKDSRKSLKKNVKLKMMVGKTGDSRNVQREAKRGKRVQVESQDADMDETFVEDICYRHFHNNIHLEGNCVVYAYGGDKRVIYEKDDEHSDDGNEGSDVEISERGEMGINPSTPLSNASPMDGDEVEWFPNQNYRENLIEQLKRPYHQEEYEHLWERVNQKISRSGDKRTSKGNAKDGLSKSYLEIYSDLEARLLTFRFERPKRLNILRGFFYWLLYEGQNGAFRPWEDSLCLAVMPGSK